MANDVWMSEPSDGTLNKLENGYYGIHEKSGRQAEHSVLQKAASISIGAAPAGELYEGDVFDPSGLVLNVKYADGSTGALSYDTHVDMFSFSPSLTTPLSSGTHNIAITSLTKSASLNVQVKEMGVSAISGEAYAGSHKLSWTEAAGAEAAGAV